MLIEHCYVYALSTSKASPVLTYFPLFIFSGVFFKWRVHSARVRSYECFASMFCTQILPATSLRVPVYSHPTQAGNI